MKKKDSNIFFSTKKESNVRRENLFLALSPEERFQEFLRMISNKFGVELIAHSTGEKKEISVFTKKNEI